MTRARMPSPHEVDAARRDPRLLRALNERSQDDAWRTRGSCRTSIRRLSFRLRTNRSTSAVALCRSVRRAGLLPCVGAGGGGLPRRLGRHHAPGTPRHAARLAGRGAARSECDGRSGPTGARPAADARTVRTLRVRFSGPAPVAENGPGVAESGNSDRARSGPGGSRSAGRPPLSLLVLGHGAGGGVDAPDLVALRDAAVAAGVAGGAGDPAVPGRRPAGARTRRSPRRGVAHRRGRAAATAPGTGAAGRRALQRRPGGLPDRGGSWRPTGLSRWPFRCTRRAARSGPGPPNCATGLPTLVVNGDRDPFGVPETGPGVQVEVRPGEKHDLRRDPAGAAAVVRRLAARHGAGPADRFPRAGQVVAYRWHRPGCFGRAVPPPRALPGPSAARPVAPGPGTGR